MPATSSSRLKERKEKVLVLWEARCLKEIHSAAGTASLALRDSLPTYLDHICEALAKNRRMDDLSVRAHDEESTRIGKMHGADRADNSSYLLTEVISEYHILREVLFQVLEQDAPLAVVERDLILDSIERAVNDAAVQFSEIHTEIQEKFVSTLTHDLKTPITAAKLGTEMILKKTGQDPVLLPLAKKVIVSLNRLEAMIHDLLDASRIRSGGALSLKFEACDLSLVIRDVVAEMTDAHGSRFVLNAEGSVRGQWSQDELRRTAENLIGNAVKYSTPGTPITVSLVGGASEVQLRVHNEGPVIPEAEIPLLFQKYRRSKSVEAGGIKGWGLGLTVVKGVVEAHAGKVRVESAAGRGTSFILDIPYHQDGVA